MTFIIPPAKSHFIYVPGTDGVDSTFDVYCLETSQQIISVGYWEAKESAESVAYAITYALNRYYRPWLSRLRKPNHDLIRRFLAENPGPFHPCCLKEPTFHVVGIATQSNDDFIDYTIAETISDGILARFNWLSHILNKVFDYPEVVELSHAEVHHGH